MDHGRTSLKNLLPELVGIVTVHVPSKMVIGRIDSVHWVGERTWLSCSVQPVNDSGHETLSAPGVLVERPTLGVTTTSFTPRTNGERLLVVT